MIETGLKDKVVIVTGAGQGLAHQALGGALFLLGMLTRRGSFPGIGSAQ